MNNDYGWQFDYQVGLHIMIMSIITKSFFQGKGGKNGLSDDYSAEQTAAFLPTERQAPLEMDYQVL